jgi:hypothetical protein
MDMSLTGSGYLLPIVLIGIIIIVVIGIAIFRRRAGEKRHANASMPPVHPLDYQPASKPTPVFKPVMTTDPLARTAESTRPKDIDLTSTKNDLTESLEALVGKYALVSFTLATADGLLFGSSGGTSPQVDAATYSEIFKNEPLTGTPGVVLFGLSHKGSELVGIVRAKTPLTEKIVQQIEADTKVILNCWI